MAAILVKLHPRPSSYSQPLGVLLFLVPNTLFRGTPSSTRVLLGVFSFLFRKAVPASS